MVNAETYNETKWREYMSVEYSAINGMSVSYHFLHKIQWPLQKSVLKDSKVKRIGRTR